jgi:hypothetical protein
VQTVEVALPAGEQLVALRQFPVVSATGRFQERICEELLDCILKRPRKAAAATPAATPASTTTGSSSSSSNRTHTTSCSSNPRVPSQRLGHRVGFLERRDHHGDVLDKLGEYLLGLVVEIVAQVSHAV